MRLDEVDLASWLLARREAPQLEDKLRKFVATLNPDRDLIETLIVYLALDQDVERSARHIYVHADTVRYRLRTCEELLGTSIGNTATIANLYLAFVDDVLALQDRIADQAQYVRASGEFFNLNEFDCARATILDGVFGAGRPRVALAVLNFSDDF
ncbi:helix-turn-helix domain-containing protein [Cryobacterium sp.]|uniref:helix-turn-helix domain-containing protein n=1 Tax=Cryobacterium sp. TaxID=1926290 RepID=UPI003416BFA1